MANTAGLNEVEDYIRTRLENDYPRYTFSEKALPLLMKTDGSYAVHKFDAVSEDNTIVASIKCHSWLTSGGHMPAGKIGQIYQSLYYLHLIDTKVKLIIFTDKNTYDGFQKTFDGKIDREIIVKYYPLSKSLGQLLAIVHNNASREMSAEN